MEHQTHFAVVTQRSATVLQLVLSQIDKEMEETEWVIHRLKADNNVGKLDKEMEETEWVGYTQTQGRQ